MYTQKKNYILQLKVSRFHDHQAILQSKDQSYQDKNQARKVYLGLTEGPWKQRNYGHKFSFSNKKYAHSTALSKYMEL